MRKQSSGFVSPLVLAGVLVLAAVSLAYVISMTVNETSGPGLTAVTAPSQLAQTVSYSTIAPVAGQNKGEIGRNTLSDLSFNSPVTAGNQVIVVVQSYHSGGGTSISAPTKSSGTASIGPFALDATYADGSGSANFRTSIYRAPVTGSGSLSLHFSGNYDYGLASVSEYSGMDANPVDGQAARSGTGSTESAGSITSSVKGMVLMSSTELSTSDFNYSQSDSNLYHADRGASGFTGQVEQKITSGPGTYNLTAASGNNWFWIAAAVAYKAASSAGGGTNPPVTPPADTTPPVISSVSVSSITLSGATISWATNEPANSQVVYGLTSSYGSNSDLDTALITNHSEPLSSLTANTVYHFAVRSRDAAGNQAQSADQTFTTSQTPQTSSKYTLTVNVGSNGSVSSALRTLNNCKTNCVINNMITGTTVTLSANPSAGYTANWSGCTSSSGNACRATMNANMTVNLTFTSTGGTPPAADNAPSIPAGLTATAISSSEIDLAWNASTDTDSTPVAGYDLYSCQGANCTNYTLLANVTAPIVTTFKNTGLAANTTYRYVVAAYDSVSPVGTHISAQSAPVLGKTQIASVSTYILTVTKSGTGTGTITGGSINCGTACAQSGVTSGTSVILTEAPAAGSTFAGWGGSCSGTATTCTISVNANKSVTATFNTSGGGGTSDTIAPSVTVFTIPASASSLSVPITTFTATDANGVTGYMITESATAPLATATGWTTIPSIGYVFTTAGSHTLYAWAKDAAGNVSATKSAKVTITLPVTTFTITAFAGSNGTISPSGAVSVNSGANQIFTITPSTGYKVNTVTVDGAAVTSVAATGGTYTFTSVLTTHTISATFTSTAVVDTTAPSVPTGLTAAAVSSSQINLSWAASTDNTGGTGVGGYNIYRGTTKVGTATTNSYSDTGLTQSTAYTYTVAAYDKASPVNTSAQSTSVSATTQAQQNGSTITAASCNSADVQAAINAASDGWTVNIPAGNCTWSSSVQVPNTKGLKIYGHNSAAAGTKGCGGCETVINPGVNDAMDIVTSAGKSVTELAYIKFSGSTAISDAVRISGNANNIRFHHLQFAYINGQSISWGYGSTGIGPFGLIDHSVFTGTGDIETMHLYGTSALIANTASPFGTANMLFIEDNAFTYDNSSSAGGLFDTYVGGERVVFRYNTVVNNRIQNHGYDNGSQSDSGFFFDVYNNNMTISSGTAGQYVYVRGGSWLVHDNTFTGNVARPLDTSNYRSQGVAGNYPVCSGYNAADGNSAWTSGSGTVTGHASGYLQDNTKAWTTNRWLYSGLTDPQFYGYNVTQKTGPWAISSNTGTQVNLTGAGDAFANGDTYKITNGYPCHSQPGVVANTVYGIYQWNNTQNGTTINWQGPIGGAYARQDDVLYNSGAVVNGAKSGYTPYTYPHPLQTGGTVNPPTTDTTKPSVPTGLTATPSKNSVALSWTASTDNTGGTGVAGYKIYKNGATTASVTVTTTSYSDTGLNPGSNYSYAVSAVDAAGNESGTTAISATTLLANSTKFTVGQQVQVITTTNVRPTPSTSGTSFGTQAVGAIGTVSNVTGQGVNANGYFWWLVGFNSASCTTAASTNCGWVAESNLQAYTAPVTYTLTVSKTGTGTGAVTATCGTATCAASVNAGTVASLSATAASGSTFTGWTGTVASTNNPLSVTVNAITTETATFNTTVVTDTTAPSVPTGLTAAAVSSSQINLSWAASTDNTGGTGVGGYNIYRGGVLIGTSLTNSYSNTGLNPSTAYTYAVAAYDKASPVNTSAQSTSVSATTQAQQNGSTITLTSAQAADATQVQSVINGAAGGSTIMIPNGSYTWGSQVTINGKTIRLLGAAKGGVTIANNTNCVGGVISINESTSGSVEVANLNFVPGTINPTSGCGNQYHIRVSAVSGGKPVLVHDNSFLTGYWNAIMWATSGGVIWNNTFHDQGQGLSGVEFVDRSGIHPWNAPSTLGMLDTNGVQNTYVEDNTFTDIFQAATNNDDNSRVVYRHNMFINSPLGSHGQETSTWGARQFEMYNNTLKFTTSGVSSTGLSYPLNVNFGYLIRGGTGVIFNNAMDNISSQAYGTKLLISLNVFSINRIDQIPCQTNYPAARQVGQGWIGTGGYAYGNNGGMSPPQSAPTNSVIVADGNGNTTDPIYIWGNTGSGTTGSNFVGVNQYAPDDCGNGQLVSKYVQAGRDYVLGQKPGYSPYTYPHPLRTTSSSGVGTTNIDGGTGGGTTNPTTFTITASAASNGTISPSGSVSVNSGANQIFNFAPASGYQVYSVTVDGVTTVSSALTSYTFSGVTGNHTISVAFQAVSGGGTSGNSYTTSFTSSENPISEGSKWINGGTTGTDWGNVATTPGLVYGPSLKTQYADPTAVLTGTWGPTQTAQATVKTSGVSTSCCHEVELRLRTTITAHSITGYEINCNVDGGNYVQIVRWNGPVNNFTILDSRAYGCANGDVLKATASGSTITVYKNGTQLYSVTDSTYTNGSPGVGFYDNGDTNWTSFGLSSFTASSN